MNAYIPSDLFRTTRWRDKVNHDSPKARRIRAAVDAIHARGQYPGCRRVMRELGETLEREGTGIEIAPGITLARGDRWMNGRDNLIRKRRMQELGITPDPNPMSDW